jgi:hypothetical protein
MPSFRLVNNISNTHEEAISWYARLLEFNAPIFLFVVIILFFIYKYNHFSNIASNVQYTQFSLSEKFIKRLFIFSFSLSIIARVIGLGVMDHREPIRLPFHLSGIIELYRRELFPMLFMIIVENYILRNKEVGKLIKVFFLWAFLEMILMLSKSVFIQDLQFVILILLLRYRPSLTKVSIKLLPLVLIFFVMYPIIQITRDNSNTSMAFSEKITSAAHNTQKFNNFSYQYTPLARVFSFDSHYIKDFQYIKSNDFFDFSRSELLYTMGGSYRYHTVVVDGFDEDARHSSGTSSLTDPLLWGGRGLMYIVVFIIVIISYVSDIYIRKRKYAVAVILFYLVVFFSSRGNVTFLLFEGRMFVPYLICLFLANKINYRDCR